MLNQGVVMTAYSYAAIDPQGRETTGTLHVADQTEALKRIKEMGFFPVKITEISRGPLSPAARARRHEARMGLVSPAGATRTNVRRMRHKTVTLFTRQLATLLEAGMPLLRSLRLLHEQEPNAKFKSVLAELAAA